MMLEKLDKLSMQYDETKPLSYTYTKLNHNKSNI